MKITLLYFMFSHISLEVHVPLIITQSLYLFFFWRECRGQIRWLGDKLCFISKIQTSIIPKIRSYTVFHYAVMKVMVK